ncbi:TonB-linked outer membrane protein, SusC/RagA family [Chitinophaga sp. 180180018-2]|nr:TonB-linked outer membrane protein, SusC/RagA family [Chitinophaga sp. 212800010-3]
MIKHIVIYILVNLHAFTQIKAEVTRQAPRITIAGNNMPIEVIFNKIKEQTGFTVINNLSETQLDKEKKITINFHNAEISEVMKVLLGEQKNLTFTLIDSQIIIHKNKHLPSEFATPSDTIPNAEKLYGKITDIDGMPIPGASIKLKNTKSGAISNVDGRFALSGFTSGSMISVTCIGYESKEVTVKEKNIFIQLKNHTNLLDERVIIAYGSTTKRFNTGNINGLKASDIEKQPVSNPLAALQGRLPGVYISPASGLAGSGMTIRIQGINSFYNGSDPYFVIDGVPYVSQLLPTKNTITGTSGVSGVSGNPLNYINPADIESIEVLKDADATAIYGSRAANGAVLITTKKGKPGPLAIFAQFEQGWSKVPRKMSVLNNKQYLEMRKEALRNDGKTPGSFDWDLNGTWDTTRNIDWQKELIGGTAGYTNAQVNISGGSPLIQFQAGGGYRKETNVFPGSYSDTKGSAHISVNSNSGDNKLKAQVTGSFTFDNNGLPQVDFTSAALTLSPVAPPLYTSNGLVNWAPNPTRSSTFFSNPVGKLGVKTVNKTSNLLSNMMLSYEFLPGLLVKTSLGYNSLYTTETALNPTSAMPPEYARYFSNSSNFIFNRINSWIVEPQMEYNHHILDGSLKALIGYTISQQNSDQQNIFAVGFPNELVMQNLGAATKLTGSNLNSIYKYNAIYARITYNWLNKYIINLTSRRDGSSRFGSQNSFHNFGAIGLAWIFTEEPFIHSLIPILSYGKLRGSYGTTGNDQIGDYNYMDTYVPVIVQGPPYQNSLGLTPNQLTNPYLQWESTKKLQFGIELGFLKDAILFTVNYNQNRSSNQLMGFNLPSITGFGNITRNIPATIQNSGWEFTITSNNIKSKAFSWSTNLNLTIPKSVVASYNGDDKNRTFFVGKPLLSSLYLDFAGVDEKTGLYQFRDAKGNLTSNPSIPDDYIILRNTDTKFYGGLQNTFTYRNFSLDIFLQFTKKPGRDFYSYGFNPTNPGLFNAGLSNQPTYILDRWQHPGDKAATQEYTSNYVNMLNLSNSTAVLTDASFIKLKNISLSWRLPDSWNKRIHTQEIRIFSNAQNILTLTKYKGLDPEIQSMSLPPLRTIVFGCRVTL